MKRFLAVLCIVMVAFAYGACGGSKSESPAAMPAMSSAAGAPNQTAYDRAGPSESGVSSTENVPKNKKIIRNARIDMEADAATAAYDALRGWAVSNGGYEFSSTTQKSDAYWTVSAQLKIKPELLDAFIEYAKGQGELINCIVSSDDISDQYVDTQSRLTSARKGLEKYYQFLDRAVNIDEILQVQREINALTGEIEAFEGKLKYWDAMVAESTIDLTIREKRDPTKIKKEVNWNAITFGDMLNLMKNGIILTANFVVSVVQWLLIVVIAAIPIGIPVAAFFLIRRYLKKKKKEKNGQLPQNKADT